MSWRRLKVSDQKNEGQTLKDREANRLGRRVGRYAKVGANMGGFAARMAGQKLMGNGTREGNARALKEALGDLKGPMMKVAQMFATIPDFLPEEYAAELAELQSAAPPMSRLFVKRRMRSELGADWQGRFGSFEKDACAAASLGQVHKATTHEGTALACKLQYPDMQSAVEADLSQLSMLFSLQRRIDGSVNTTEMAVEIGDRLREELDYKREAAHMRLYGNIFADETRVHIPECHPDLSTGRLLSMSWMEGNPMLSFKDRTLEERNKIAEAMFMAWWVPFSQYAVIHGDPHLGNYSVREDLSINLLDFGCIRVFRPGFVEGISELYQSLLTDDRDRSVAAYEIWGFENLSNELVDTLNVWAKFIYGPMLDDRVRSIADGVTPGQYGRKEAMAVHKALKKHGPVTPPREFVFMDRAAIGLGGVFLHLGAEMNFYRLFNETFAGFDPRKLEKRQEMALNKAGVPLPS
ncbi:MAG: AarF/ABC1/UbiB kinase family protein [Rhizobiaceae bacterium]|nr:AarF/ABC1/UbiB kinase family protein [Rhizobiaceae bacterium]